MSLILQPHEVASRLRRLGHEILERNQAELPVILLGIPRRGVPMAERIAGHLRDLGKTISVGEIEFAAHRDDRELDAEEEAGAEWPLALEVPIDGAVVVLVDDVLHTGRTIRAAIDALVEQGRPAQIQVAVLIDRGHREVPIKADFVGMNVPTSEGERVFVKLEEVDSEDGAYIESLVSS